MVANECLMQCPTFQNSITAIEIQTNYKADIKLFSKVIVLLSV